MLSQLLAQRQAQGKPIHVGIIGTGKFGAGLVAQISQMQGMETSVIADINLDHARHVGHGPNRTHRHGSGLDLDPRRGWKIDACSDCFRPCCSCPCW